MKLRVQNFRSIERQVVDLAPITLVYGANSAGKSSLLYALATLRNVVLNPNQEVNALFNYGFANLGGFEAVVFDHREDGTISLGLEVQKGDTSVDYLFQITKDGGRFCLTTSGKAFKPIRFDLTVSFPYPANQEKTQAIEIQGAKYNVSWNGVVAKIAVVEETSESDGMAAELAELLNMPTEMLRQIGFVPLKRGFSKPNYSVVSPTPILVSEDEVATVLAQEKYLAPKVSHYLEKTISHDLRITAQLGTSVFSLDSTDKNTGVAVELVNEGFGVNQLVYLYAKCLRHNVKLVCVEEPEIHLHPQAVRQLARALREIVANERKQFLISTHSEAYVVALLALVAQGKLQPDDVACYHAQKARKSTSFEKQKINEDGQIEGGLSDFIEAQLEDVKAFLS